MVLQSSITSVTKNVQKKSLQIKTIIEFGIGRGKSQRKQPMGTRCVQPVSKITKISGWE